MCDIELTFKTPFAKSFIPTRGVWKLCNPDIQSDFQGGVGRLLTSCDRVMTTDPDTAWEVLKTTLLKTIEVCGGLARRNPMRNLGNKLTVSVKLQVSAGVSGRLESRGKLVKRNA